MRPKSYKPSTTRECLVCGKSFKAYQCKIDVGKAKYCGKACSMSVTNAKLEQNGVSSRFEKGMTPYNKIGHRLTRSRNGGNAYRLIHMPLHPFATKSGYVREHRLVVERARNITLNPWMDVHHKNGDTLDNRVENLEVISHADHTREHNPVLVRWGKEAKL